MNKLMIVAAGIFGAMALLGLMLIFGYIDFTNTANRFENGIKAQYSENQNVYDNGWKKVTEVAQVPQAQVAALKDVYMGAISGTFGANGSQALLQAFQVHQINIDQQTYVRIQTVIEEFRNAFQQRQSEMVSRTQAYENFLTATTSGRFYNMLGNYPHIDMEKYTKLVTSQKTEDVFKSKQDEALTIPGVPKGVQ